MRHVLRTLNLFLYSSLFPIVALAATFNVDSFGDGNDQSVGDGICRTTTSVCTLRAAIQEANFNTSLDEINLPSGTYSLTLAGIDDNSTAGDIDITSPLKIIGQRASDTIIQSNVTQGNSEYRIFHIAPNNNIIDVTITNVGIKNGYANQGAGIYIENGNVALNDTHISNNNATLGNNGKGGGIYNKNGTLTIYRSIISNNNAGANNIGAGGGLFAENGKTYLINTIIAANEAKGINGGGLFNSSTQLVIASSTIAQNRIAGVNASGAGLYTNINNSVILKNSIIAQNKLNITSSTPISDCAGEIKSEGYNLIGNATGCTISNGQTTDKIGTSTTLIEAGLGALYTDTTGGIETLPLLPNSPAIDAGNPSGCLDHNNARLENDQRGNNAFPRHITSNTGTAGRCDIGAFEYTTNTNGTSPSNNLPTAFGFNMSAWTNQTVFGVLPATDPNGSPNSTASTLSFISNTLPQKGSLSINSTTGFFQYTPNNNLSGNDTFSYYVKNSNNQESPPATVNIIINNTQQTPSPDQLKTINMDLIASADKPLVGIFGIVDEDGEYQGWDLSVNTNQLSKGTLQQYNNQSVAYFIYTPSSNFAGTDSFQYTVTDRGNDRTSTSLVTLSLQNATGPVSIRNLAFDNVLKTSSYNNGLVIGVTNPNNLTLTYNLATQAAYGSANISATGNFTYIPNNNIPTTIQQDTFTYTITYFDTATGLNTTTTPATATLNFLSNNVSVSVTNNTFNNISRTNATSQSIANLVSKPNTITITNYNLVTSPAYGGITIQSNGNFTYTPNNIPQNVNQVTFSFSVSYTENNVTQTSNNATITLNLSGGGGGGIGNDFTVSEITINATRAGQSTGSLSSTVNNPNNLVITQYSRTVAATYGNVSIVSGTGEFTYTPRSTIPNTVAQDSFQFAVTYTENGLRKFARSTAIIRFNGDTPAGTVTIDNAVFSEVSRTNPYKNSLMVQVKNPNNLAINFPSNSIDANFGNVIISQSGEFTYTPSSTITDNVNQDSFKFSLTYTNSSGAQVVSNVATIQLNFTAINTSIQAIAHSTVFDAFQSTTLNGQLHGHINGSNASITFEIMRQPSKGTLNLNSTTGVFIYQPNADATESDSFEFRVKDSQGNTVSNNAVVTIKLNPRPVITEDSGGGGSTGLGAVLLLGWFLLTKFKTKK